MLKTISQFLYPPCCLVCGAKGRESFFLELCSFCDPSPVREEDDLSKLSSHFLLDTEEDRHESLLSRYCICCQEPQFALDTSGLCPLCRTELWPWRSFRSLWRYADLVEDLLKSLKYRGQYGLAKTLGELLARTIGKDGRRTSFFPNYCDWDLIIPLPSSALGTYKRGYAPVHLVCQTLSRRSGIRMANFALRDAGKSKTQVGLDPAERFDNARGAFCAASAKVKGRSVLLVDDVVTSGASIDAATWALLQAGATSVDVLTLARSIHYVRLRLLGLQLRHQFAIQSRLTGA